MRQEQSSRMEDCPCCASRDTRRGFLGGLAAAVATIHVMLGGRSALADASQEARKAAPQPGDRLTFLAKSKRGPSLKPADVELSTKQLLAVAVDPATGTARDGSRFNQIMLTRFDPADLDDETRGRAADGVVAYSSICTHDACAVSSWDAAKLQYMCPCHQSAFDPKAGGVVASGPAYRPLPALPLTVENGEIVVAAAFTARIGGGRRG